MPQSDYSILIMLQLSQIIVVTRIICIHF